MPTKHAETSREELTPKREQNMLTGGLQTNSKSFFDDMRSAEEWNNPKILSDKHARHRIHFSSPY